MTFNHTAVECFFLHYLVWTFPLCALICTYINQGYTFSAMEYQGEKSKKQQCILLHVAGGALSVYFVTPIHSILFIKLWQVVVIDLWGWPARQLLLSLLLATVNDLLQIKENSRTAVPFRAEFWSHSTKILPCTTAFKIWAEKEMATTRKDGFQEQFKSAQVDCDVASLQGVLGGQANFIYFFNQGN